MDHPNWRSEDEILAVFGVVVATGCLGAMAPAFDQIYTTYHLALPPSTQLAVGALPAYLLAFIPASLIFLALIAERLGEDRGWTARVRERLDAALIRRLGARAIPAKIGLLKATMLCSAAMLFFGVFAFFQPVNAVRSADPVVVVRR
jgi:hypothetical protein